MSSPDVYAVARVRGLRTRLLGRRRMVELAAQADLAGKLELLRRAGLIGTTAATVDAAARDLAKGLWRDTVFVDGLLEAAGARRLLRAVLGIADAWSLKTVLRGVARSEPSASLLALAVPTFDFDEAAFKELVAQRTVKAVIDLLATWRSPFAPALLAAAAAAGGHVDPSALELAIDRVAFARAARAAAKHPAVARLVAESVDLANAVTLLELSGRAAGRELFLEGGQTLARRRFERLAASPSEARGAVAADRALGLGPAMIDGAPDPFLLDRLVRRRPLVALRRAAREEPLSIAVPLVFLLERQEEVRSARTILEGGAIGLPAGELVDLAEVGT